MTESFAQRLQAVREEIARVALAAGRSPESVRLLAVSKTFPAAAVREAYAAGLRCFGENKIQELELKRPQLPGDIEWHFIGHLQSNKAARAVELADWIHSVDSLKLLSRLDRLAGERNRRPVILIEVNSGETEKSGVDYAALPELAAAAANAEHLDWRGLMTMAPLSADPAVWRRAFERLRSTRDELECRLGVKLPELSMGMSGDFPAAVAAGATLVRIGSALFGSRIYA